MHDTSALPIEEKQLAEFLERADRLLAGVKWTPKAPGASKKESSKVGWRDSSVSAGASSERSLVKIGRAISRSPVLMAEEINHSLSVIRTGLCVGMHLSKTYTKFSGLDQLIALNGRGGLAEGQKTEFRAKYHTASAIALFGLAYYVTWELSRYKADKVGSVAMEFEGIPEMPLRDPVRAVDCQLFYYASYLDGPGVVRTSLDFVKMTQLYFKALVDEVKLREESLQYTEPFTGQRYKLEESEFSVDGFEVSFDGAEVSVEFNRVELNDIVGNRDAKHDARRLAARLLCYDPVTQLTTITTTIGEQLEDC
ncbi:MAG: hypothetical protein AAF492_14640 [Verrucomicrobiota bacterium]